MGLNEELETVDIDLIQFDQARQMIAVVSKECENIVINSKDSLEFGKEIAKKADKIKKAIEAKRVELKAPYLEQGKKIDEVAKKVIGQLDTSIEGLRKQIRIFELELEKIRQEELRKLEEERRRNEQIRLEQEEAQRKAEALAAKKHQPPPPPLPVVDNSVNDLELALKQKELESQKSKSLRKVWDFDIMDANAIPREFLSIDEKKIRGAIAAGIHEIDGLRIYQRNDLILR